MATVTEAPVVEIDTPREPLDTLYEVIDGQIVEKPMGALEFRIASRLHGHLWTFVDAHGLGETDVEMLFLIDEATGLKRRPDVSFISRERWPIDEPVPSGEPLNVVPDLAVEVVSPSNYAFELLDKVRDYFQAGVRRVWLFYPTHELVYVHESPTKLTILGAGDVLDGGDVIPGFRLPLSAIYRPRPQAQP